MAASFLTRSQYAAHIGRSPSYVTQLAAQGRVVFTPDGRFVDVAKTNALVATTADPAKQPVADRHAAARNASNAQSMPQPVPDDESPATAQPGPSMHPAARQDAATAAGNTYQQARAVKERYLALDAKRAYEHAMGQLRDAREVEHAVATAFTATRQALQNLASTLAPVLAAANTEEAARTELSTAIEAVLAELSTTLANMATNAKQQAHA